MSLTGRTRAATTMVVVWMVVVLLAACAPHPKRLPGAVERPRVVVSLPPLAWMVERLAGERVEVEVALPPATAPEGWAPSPTAMLAVAGADLYFGVGHPAIGFETKLLAQASAGGVTAVALLGRGGDAINVRSDPHAWLDPSVVRETLEPLAAALAELDPEGAKGIETNAAALRAEIAALEGELETLFADRERGIVVVQHSAWSRLLERHGIVEQAIERDGKGPEPSRMIELVEMASAEGVATVFTQRGLSDRSARLIARELEAQLVILDPLASEWAVNLGESARAFSRAVH